jgi:hypothetical protein
MSIDKRRLPQRGRPTPLRSQRHDAIRKTLLATGPVSSLLYVIATDILAASRWDGYRRTEQMVSDWSPSAPPAGDSGRAVTLRPADGDSLPFAA